MIKDMCRNFTETELRMVRQDLGSGSGSRGQELARLRQTGMERRLECGWQVDCFRRRGSKSEGLGGRHRQVAQDAHRTGENGCPSRHQPRGEPSRGNLLRRHRASLEPDDGFAGQDFQHGSDRHRERRVQPGREAARRQRSGHRANLGSSPVTLLHARTACNLTSRHGM